MTANRLVQSRYPQPVAHREPLAERRRERDHWPNEPKETYEATERDRDGRFPELLDNLLERGESDGS